MQALEIFEVSDEEGGDSVKQVKPDKDISKAIVSFMEVSKYQGLTPWYLNPGMFRQVVFAPIISPSVRRRHEMGETHDFCAKQVRSGAGSDRLFDERLSNQRKSGENWSYGVHKDCNIVKLARKPFVLPSCHAQGFASTG